jgi:glycosyltransferase involved in cell wall biosynthesis
MAGSISDTPQISFIMPARNEERYIAQAIGALHAASYAAWELIVVDDHSTDGTRAAVRQFAASDPRIQIVENPGTGKVATLNEGFRRSSGNFIKFIDADDIVRESYFSHIDEITAHPACCHDYLVVHEDRRPIADYSVSGRYLSATYEQTLASLLSIPRASWTFRRDIASRFLPMPAALPFEDVWMSLMAKKFAADIHHIPESLYEYRQHSGQTFGGILNFRRDIIVFRSRRLLKLMEVLIEEKIETNIAAILQQQKTYCEILAREPRTWTWLFSSSLSIPKRAHLFLMLFLPGLAPMLKRGQWALQRLGRLSRQRETGSRNG